MTARFFRPPLDEAPGLAMKPVCAPLRKMLHGLAWKSQSPQRSTGPTDHPSARKLLQN